MNLADMLIEGYVAESTILRVEKLIWDVRRKKACEIQKEIPLSIGIMLFEKAASAGRSQSPPLLKAMNSPYANGLGNASPKLTG